MFRNNFTVLIIILPFRFCEVSCCRPTLCYCRPTQHKSCKVNLDLTKHAKYRMIYTRDVLFNLNICTSTAFLHYLYYWSVKLLCQCNSQLLLRHESLQALYALRKEYVHCVMLSSTIRYFTGLPWIFRQSHERFFTRLSL